MQLKMKNITEKKKKLNQTKREQIQVRMLNLSKTYERQL